MKGLATSLSFRDGQPTQDWKIGMSVEEAKQLRSELTDMLEEREPMDPELFATVRRLLNALP